MRKSSTVLALLAPVIATVLAPLFASTALAQDPAAPGPGSAYRPAPIGVGIGAGYTINSAVDLQKPTNSSVRLVLSDQLTVEPFVELSYVKSSTEASITNMANPPVTVTTTAESSLSTFEVGGRARFVLGSRGPVDLSALGSAAVRFQSVSGSNIELVSTQQFALRWGIALTWYMFRNWSLSLDAENPLFVWTREKHDFPQPAMPDTVQSNILFGIVWKPVVSLMVHFYF